jgi:hypothetical protein
MALAFAAPAAAAEQTALQNISTIPIRVCAEVSGCQDRGTTLHPGQLMHASFLGRKATALYVQSGWRAVIAGEGKLTVREGPATVALPPCACTRTVQMMINSADGALTPAPVTARPLDGTSWDSVPAARTPSTSTTTRKPATGKPHTRTTSRPAAKITKTTPTSRKPAATKASTDAKASTQQSTGSVAPSSATAKLGTSRSGLPWLSGVWMGSRFSPAAARAYGSWRGRQLDVITAYSNRTSYERTVHDTWSINVWNGLPGRLNYGLGILPNSGEGSLDSIARGDQDWVWRAVAKNLVSAGRGNSIVRIGWEANLPDWRWGVTASTAPKYRAAFRRVAKTMKATAPKLVIDFGIGCGPGLPGSSSRTASLTKLYPGDDVVNVVECDIYDWWSTRVRSSATPVLTPKYGVGLQDLAKFARAHHKLVGVGEWGLSRPSNGNGGGDNPAFIKAMHDFFRQNASVMAYECYFDEPADYLRSSLSTGQNPRAAAVYKNSW